MQKYIVLLSLLSLFSINVFAVVPEYTEFNGFCPQPHELIKATDSTWTTKSNWRSFNPSFVEELTVFIGAQWQGEKIGQLLCRYSNQSNVNFPVTIQAPFLSKTPAGNGWKNDYVNFNTKNCYAVKVEDCPVVGLQKKQLNIDTEDNLRDFLKTIRESKN